VHEGTPGGEHREVGVQVGEPSTATLDASRKKKSPGERKAAARMSERRWSASTSACTAASRGWRWRDRARVSGGTGGRRAVGKLDGVATGRRKEPAWQPRLQDDEIEGEGSG
jgi:hypothetical protein